LSKQFSEVSLYGWQKQRVQTADTLQYSGISDFTRQAGDRASRPGSRMKPSGWLRSWWPLGYYVNLRPSHDTSCHIELWLCCEN
jgi:hypothetical protein